MWPPRSIAAQSFVLIQQGSGRPAVSGRLCKGRGRVIVAMIGLPLFTKIFTGQNCHSPFLRPTHAYGCRDLFTGIPNLHSCAGYKDSPRPLLSLHPPRFMKIPLHHTLTHIQKRETLMKDFQEQNRGRREALLNLPSLQSTFFMSPIGAEPR
jgi:hypothetical protein